MKPGDPSIGDDAAYDRRLSALAEQLADPVAGFFGPGSVSWKVNREPTLLLGGMRALLMQIAHPKVARGVAEHSRFRSEPFGRLLRTLRSVHAVVFGDRDSACTAALEVHRIHARVSGRLPVAIPPGSDPRYRANQADLLLWVYATLMDSAVYTYDLFFPPLSDQEREQLYAEGKCFAQIFGVPPACLPATWNEFRTWMDETLDGETIQVTPAALEITRALFHGTPATLALGLPNYVLAAGMLPAGLRDAFQLKWNAAVRVAFRASVGAVRGLMRVTPEAIRLLPVARRAQRRCAAQRLTSGSS